MKLNEITSSQIVKDVEDRIIKGDVKIPSTATTLVGRMHAVRGKIIPIRGATVTGSFYCDNTKIVSLRGSPSKVYGKFFCSMTKITSLEGAPSYVGGNFECYGTRIESLHNVHKQIKHIGEKMYLPTTITSHILGLVYIKGLKHTGLPGLTFRHAVRLNDALDIIDKYLPLGNIHECQEELLEAGLKEFARL